MASPSYLAWYGLPEQDPYGGQYTEVYNVLSPVPGTMPPDDLWTYFTAGGQDTKAAFLFLGSDNKLCMLHRLQRLSPVFGAPSLYDGASFATYNDVTMMGATTVVVPAALFHITPQPLPIRTLADIDAALGASPGAHQLAPLAAGDPAAEEVRTRCGMMIPPVYVPEVLQAISCSPVGLTPRGLWEGVIARIRDDADQTLACQ